MHLMTDSGARIELVRELRRIGTRYADVADMLDIALVFMPDLPGDAVFALDYHGGVLTVIDDESSELSIWAGLAYYLALDLAIDATVCDLLDVASRMCVKSAIMQRVSA